MDMGASSMAMGSSTSSPSSASTSLANLTLGDPRCNSDSCPAFKAAHDESQATVSYNHQYLYGEWLSYYYVAVLFLFVVAYIYHLWLFRKARATSSSTTLADKAVAATRFCTYRRIPGIVGVYLGLPSFGLRALTLFSLLLILALSFAIHPFYRRYRGFGSPPLAIRAGLMAVALTPLIFALSGKFNLITLITGVGHEKLNVFHRYVSYACLILSIIHTVPYLVNDGAGPTLFGINGITARWYAAGSFEFTGTPPLGILVFLCVFSIPYLRHRVYELFKYFHYAAAVTYLGLMFWHCGNEGNSWYYLYATVAIFGFSLLGRVFFKTSSIVGKRWFENNMATIQPLGRSMLKVCVFAPATESWNTGQHVFLRFPSIRIFANHPFTIASIPANLGGDHQEMVFLIRPYRGFTAILHSMAVSSPSAELTLSVDVGGPYGGLGLALERRYQSVILVAGGGGISSVLPWLLQLAEKMRVGEDCLTREVILVWAVQHADAISWVREQLIQAVAIAPKNSIIIRPYVTRPQDVVDVAKPSGTDGVLSEKDSKDESEKSDAEENDIAQWAIEYGRPNLFEVVPNAVKHSRTVVLSCGPESMKIDISNVVAGEQRRILKGDLKEVALHTETFGW